MQSPLASRKRVLVTGGLGYIGSWIVRHLAQAGHEVFVLSRGGLSRDRLPDLGAPYTFIAGDIAQETPEALAERLPSGLDACIHTAAAVDGGTQGYARTALLVNSLGTRNILEALCLREKDSSLPHLKRTSSLPLFIYFSTFHVYGAGTGSINEATPPAPVNDYGLTHLFGEEYCALFSRTKGLPFVILRPSNGYGAPVYAPFSQWNLLINDLCRSAFESGRLVVRGRPDLERDFVWLGDVARVVEGLLSRRELSGQVLNLSSGASLSLAVTAILAAQTAASVLRKSVAVEFLAAGYEGGCTLSPEAIFSMEETIAMAQKTFPKLNLGSSQLMVENTALRQALGLELSGASRMHEEMKAVLGFLATHEYS